MPRIARGLADNYIYHILNRGNNKKKIFCNEEDYRMFINLMIKAKAQYAVRIFAYCLMPNHFHMVLMPVKAIYLSKWMQWLMTSHVRRYHMCYGTSGHIWQGRFKSFVIQKDEHLLTAMRYVEGNPVRAGLAGSAEDWPWSSHKEVISSKRGSLIDPPSIERPKKWNKYVDEPLTEKELEKVRQSLIRQAPYGAKPWQSTIARKLGLESTLRPRGRPEIKK